MTLKELKQKLNGITNTGYGHYRISFYMYGKIRSCITTNTLAIDRINSEDYDCATNQKRFYATVRQAYQALWNETKIANNLR